MNTQQYLPWIIVAIVVLLAPLLTILVLRGRKASQTRPLPSDWALTARPVFTSDERRIYRLLREALPHHVILSKLPLVRFCQPSDSNQVRYWYDLLGTIHVTFAICSANGRVLAAIDLEAERGHSSRIQRIKQSVLDACRVRHLVCPVDHLPSIAELQLLVPHSGSAARAPLPPASLHQARNSLSSTVANKRAERTALWQDSRFQDSFFAMDSRLDGFTGTDFNTLVDAAENSPSNGAPQAAAIDRTADSNDDIGGVVVDSSPSFSRRARA